MNQVIVSMPPQLQQWVDARLAEGGFADAEDYLRQLVRHDRETANEGRRWLRAMIEEGLASGVVDRDADEVLDEIIAEDADLRD